jgi:hypothetical protein
MKGATPKSNSKNRRRNVSMWHRNAKVIGDPISARNKRRLAAKKYK